MQIRTHISNGASFTIKGYGILVVAKVKGSQKGIGFFSDGYNLENIYVPEGVNTTISSGEVTITDTAGQGFDSITVLGKEVSFS